MVAAEVAPALHEELQRAGIGGERLGKLFLRRRNRRGLRDGRRRRRVDDLVDEDRRARDQGEAEVAPVHVVVVDFEQPRLIRARRVAAGMRASLELADVAVVAVDEGRAWTILKSGSVLFFSGVIAASVAENFQKKSLVTLSAVTRWGRWCSCPACPCTSSARRRMVTRVFLQHAEVVLRERIAVTVAEAAEVGGLDVRMPNVVRVTVTSYLPVVPDRSAGAAPPVRNCRNQQRWPTGQPTPRLLGPANNRFHA